MRLSPKSMKIGCVWSTLKSNMVLSSNGKDARFSIS